MQSLKTAKILALWSLLVACVALIPALILTSLFYRSEFTALCLSKDCLERFASVFEIPINVFVYSFYGVVAIAAVLQLKEQKKTREQAEKSAHSTASLSHLNEFRLFISYELKLFQLLTEEHVSATLLHNALFPELSSRSGHRKKSSLEEDVPDLVESLREFIVRRHNQYADGTDNFDKIKHLEGVVQHWASVGVFIGDLHWDAYCDLEREAILLLNKVITAFRSETGELPTEINYYAA